MAPLDADAFLETVEFQQGEQPIEFDTADSSEHPAKHLTGQPPAFDQVAGATDRMSDHLVDFDPEAPIFGEHLQHGEPPMHGEAFSTGQSRTNRCRRFGQRRTWIPRRTRRIGRIVRPTGIHWRIERRGVFQSRSCRRRIRRFSWPSGDPLATEHSAETSGEHAGEAEHEFQFAATEPDAEEESQREEERAASGASRRWSNPRCHRKNAAKRRWQSS